MVRLLKLNSKQVSLLGLLTIICLSLELKSLNNLPNMVWLRPLEWIGSLWVYILTAIFYLTSIGLVLPTKKNSPFKEQGLYDFLLASVLPLLFTLSLGALYLLKILLGRGGPAENSLFFVREVGLFPSGHTFTGLLSLTLLYNALFNLIKKERVIRFSGLGCFLIFSALVTSLFLSGDHYMSDILSSVTLYFLLINLLNLKYKVRDL